MPQISTEKLRWFKKMAKDQQLAIDYAEDKALIARLQEQLYYVIVDTPMHLWPPAAKQTFTAVELMSPSMSIAAKRWLQEHRRRHAQKSEVKRNGK